MEYHVCGCSLLRHTSWHALDKLRIPGVFLVLFHQSEDLVQKFMCSSCRGVVRVHQHIKQQSCISISISFNVSLCCVQVGTLVTPVMCAHYLTAGIKFVWDDHYNTYIADDAQHLILLYKWTGEWVEKIRLILIQLGMWDFGTLV